MNYLKLTRIYNTLYHRGKAASCFPKFWPTAVFSEGRNTFSSYTLLSLIQNITFKFSSQVSLLRKIFHFTKTVSFAGDLSDI